MSAAARRVHARALATLRGLGVAVEPSAPADASPPPAPAAPPAPAIVGVQLVPQGGPPVSPINLDNLQTAGGRVDSPQFQQLLADQQAASSAQAAALQSSYTQAQANLEAARQNVAEAIQSGRISADEAPEIPSLSPLWAYEVGRVVRSYGIDSLIGALFGGYFASYPGFDPSAPIFNGQSLNEIAVRYQATRDSGGLEDFVSYEGNRLDNLTHAWEENPERVLLGINTPLESSVWSRILNKDYAPTMNQYGGDTEADYKSQYQDDPGAANTGHSIHTMAKFEAGFIGGQAAGAGLENAGIFDTVYSMGDEADVSGSEFASDFDAANFGADFSAFDNMEFPAISEDVYTPIEPSEAAIVAEQASFAEPYAFDVGAEIFPEGMPAAYAMPQAFAETPETLASWGLEETAPGSGVWQTQENYAGTVNDFLGDSASSIGRSILNRLFMSITGELWKYVSDGSSNVLQPQRVFSFTPGTPISPVPGGGRPAPIVIKGATTSRGGSGVPGLKPGKLADTLTQAGIPAALALAGLFWISKPRKSRRQHSRRR